MREEGRPNTTPRALLEDLRETSAALAPALERACDLPGPGEPFAVWECRAASARGALEAIELDGGCRAERQPAAPQPGSWRYAVGAPPTALPRLWSSRTPAAPVRAPAAERVAGVALALARRCGPVARALERAAREAGLEGRVSARARVRARIVKRGDRPPTALLESGVSFRWEGEAAFEWSGVEPEEAPWSPGTDRSEWEALLAAAIARGERPRPAAPLPAALDRYEGPAVLVPDAAAWWVHEMAHAAIEGFMAAGGAAAIRDLPRRAPWPAGFEIDDEGHPARGACLWGSGAPGHAARRRASIREPAIPAPSCTLLEFPRGAPGGIPSGVPVLLTCTRGRLDLPSGSILLEADTVLASAARPGGAYGPAVVTIDPVQAWRGLRPLGDGKPSLPRAAVCTRQGQTLPVMVGAPTIMLDPVRIERAERA